MKCETQFEVKIRKNMNAKIPMLYFLLDQLSTDRHSIFRFQRHPFCGTSTPMKYMISPDSTTSHVKLFVFLLQETIV